MRRSISSFVVVLAVTVFLATGASAQNLLVNPDFDTDVIPGWDGLGVWDPMDAFGSPSSGSATWTNTFTSGGAAYLQQCIEVPVFFEGFDLSGFSLVPSGQASTGESYPLCSFLQRSELRRLHDNFLDAKPLHRNGYMASVGDQRLVAGRIR